MRSVYPLGRLSNPPAARGDVVVEPGENADDVLAESSLPPTLAASARDSHSFALSSIVDTTFGGERAATSENETAAQHHDIVVVGASAGGVDALRTFVGELPEGLDASVLVVLHIPATADSALPMILERAGRLPASHATDGEPLRRGHIIVAPPDLHMLLHNGSIKLSRSAKENGHRPAIDPLFRTAALTYGPRVVGIVLSGTLDDGALGSRAIKAVGGVTMVQEPSDALYPEMPRSAIALDSPDYVLPASQIGSRLGEILLVPPRDARTAFDALAVESEYLAAGEDAGTDDTTPWQPSDFVCPACGGVLREVEESATVRFRCRVGHSYSLSSMLANQSDSLDAALWTAYRALEERVAMSRRLADRFRNRGTGWAARKFVERAEDTQRQADLIRELLERVTPLPAGGETGAAREAAKRDG